MNNNMLSDASNRCKCGRYITIGEKKSRGLIVGQYECPTCLEKRREKEHKEKHRFFTRKN
jgi:late competence protein required for DNA uptake (superfamily II DNA/RNA helicase)